MGVLWSEWMTGPLLGSRWPMAMPALWSPARRWGWLPRTSQPARKYAMRRRRCACSWVAKKRAAVRERNTEALMDLEQALRRLLYQRRLDQVGVSTRGRPRRVDGPRDRGSRSHPGGRGQRSAPEPARPRAGGVMATKIIVIHGWPGLGVAVAMRPCSVCGEPVYLETAHYPHEPGCPNRIVGVHVDCQCDLVAHPQCCPECQAHGESLLRRAHRAGAWS
jgi:hypothetical protein